MFSNAYTGDSKKPYSYQVNCHLKFGGSLFSKNRQTIRREDKQESKRKQKTRNTPKKAQQPEKRLH